MTLNSSRREFFNKFLGGKSAQKFITPPYFSNEFDCADCKAPCVNVCDEKLLSFENNQVKFEFNGKGCNFCKKCAIACESINKNVINLKFPATIGANVSIDVNNCLAWNDTICYNCQDICKFGAIDFMGVFRPIINQKCVGCAQCLEVCFVNSIKLEAR
jgi:4Fe-4S ferredoxin, iron-sulfur-binding